MDKFGWLVSSCMLIDGCCVCVKRFYISLSRLGEVYSSEQWGVNFMNKSPVQAAASSWVCPQGRLALHVVCNRILANAAKKG